jgi:hypothetical protein
MDIDALKQQLQERANLSPEQAEQAAQVALEFFADRIPQAGDLLEKAGGAEGVARRLGGFFGKRD